MNPLSPIELLNGRRIGDGEPCFIVAEIGQNHQGDAYTATRLLKVAHDAGVDAVKFQARHVAADLTQAARCEPYAGPQSFGATYGEHREALELSEDQYRHLALRMTYNEWPEILFATACDRESVDMLERAIDPPLYKVASRDLDNLPLIEYVARLGKPIILSSGFATRHADIASAIVAARASNAGVVLLYCVSHYPAPDELFRLQAIIDFRDKFGVHIGFSDHSRGLHMAGAAVALGAAVVEKHITLHRDLPGSDHAASIEPNGLCKYVRNIRAVDDACRQPFAFVPPPAEKVEKLGRSLVTTHPIAKGARIPGHHLCLKSPGTGIRWADRESVIDKTAARNLEADETITREDIR